MDKEYLEQLKSYYVIKDNVLNESICELSKNEYRLLLVAISKITPINTLNPIYLDVKTFAKLLDIQSKAIYERVEKLCHQLQTKVVTLYLDKDNKTYLNTKKSKKSNWVKFNWFYRIRYNDGLIEFRFHDELKPYLLDLKMYTKYNLRNILSLSSKFSIRIYELCIQYYKLTPKNFSIEDIKLLIGADKSSYANIAHFKRLVNSCIEEINIKTDIFIGYSLYKQGRSFKFIKFSIIHKSKMYNTEDYSNIEKSKLIVKLQNSIFNKTGFVVEYGDISEFHRIAIIDVLNIFNNNGFNTLIHSPKNFFIWHLKDKESNYDLEKLEDY